MPDSDAGQVQGVNLGLIGARASGKSTIGPLLAQRLGMEFIDTDERTLDRFQETTVQDAWRIHGEAAWRGVELEVALELLAGEGQVLAMGGGMPIIAGVGEAMQQAQEAGRLVVIYLDAPGELLASRLSGLEGDRPSLTGKGVIEEIGGVLADRDPVYRALCDMAIQALDEPAESTVDRLVAALD